MNAPRAFQLAAPAPAQPTLAAAGRAPVLPTRSASRQLELPFTAPQAAPRHPLRTA